MTRGVLVLDCGATNVKACLVAENGDIINTDSIPNETSPDPELKGGLIWDIHDICKKLILCCRNVCSNAGDVEISALTVTSFGVDGAAMKKDGSLIYPVISWQCPRTEEVEKQINKYIDPDWLYQKTGLRSYHFNTINRLIWLKENKPGVISAMDYYVLMPSIILHFLSGEFVTDTTMAGTSMLTSLKERSFSSEIFERLQLLPSVFPELVEPGTVIGKLQENVAAEIGISQGIPVIAAGHDTQFAVLASGAETNQPVLSSGTWEILMVRARETQLKLPSRNEGITVEWDALPGQVNLGLQWVASGVTEWLGRLLYGDLEEGNSRYGSMMEEASFLSAGSKGVTVIPEIFPGGFSGKMGRIDGLTHDVTRAHIYRATLEALCYYTRYALEKIQRASGSYAESIICVGGGSKNKLWNQLRADILGFPVKVSDIREATATGAAMIACSGLGIYKNIEDAVKSMKCGFTEYEPGKDKLVYNEMYLRYIESVML